LLSDEPVSPRNEVERFSESKRPRRREGREDSREGRQRV